MTGNRRDSRALVLEALKRYGREVAREVQERAPEMTGAEVAAERNFLPAFDPTRQYLNFLAGYVCRTPRGNTVRLLQPYDSATYPQEPEELSAQWGFCWPTDPALATEFISLATSPYMIGDCCREGGHVWRSTMDGNVYAPSGYPAGWEDLGEIEK